MFRILLLTLTLLSQPLLAAQTIIVATDVWVNYTQKDGSGYYLSLLEQIFPAPDYELEIRFVPYARSVQMVKDGEADLALGLYKGEVPDDQLSPYIVERDLVDALISPQLAKSWSGVESLTGKKVTAVIGYGFDGITDVKMNYSEKSELQSMVKMLKAGRVDAVLDYEEDLQPHISSAGLGPEFEIKKRVMGSPVYFAFAGNAQGNAFKTRFNQQFKTLWDSGAVHKLMMKEVGDSGSLPEQQPD